MTLTSEDYDILENLHECLTYEDYYSAGSAPKSLLDRLGKLVRKGLIVKRGDWYGLTQKGENALFKQKY